MKEIKKARKVCIEYKKQIETYHAQDSMNAVSSTGHVVKRLHIPAVGPDVVCRHLWVDIIDVGIP